MKQIVDSLGVETISSSARVANHNSGAAGLIDGQVLLDRMFDPQCRPSMRWLRQLTADRRIPFCKIGGKVLFDEQAVRRHFGIEVPR